MGVICLMIKPFKITEEMKRGKYFCQLEMPARAIVELDLSEIGGLMDIDPELMRMNNIKALRAVELQLAGNLIRKAKSKRDIKEKRKLLEQIEKCVRFEGIKKCTPSEE